MSSDLVPGIAAPGASGPGLWIATANPNPLAHLLGFGVTTETTPVFPEALIGVWLIASDYLDLPPKSDGDTKEPTSRLLEWLLVMHPRDDLLMGLAALNHIAATQEATSEWLAAYRGLLAEPARDRLDVALAGDADGHRVFLTRPTILRSIRLVGEHAPGEELVRQARLEAIPDAPVWDLLFVATLISHLVAERLGLEVRAENVDDDRLSGLPSDLALEMVCSGMSTRQENPGNLLGRARLMYVEYGPRVVRNPARLSPLALVEDALGMPLDDALAIGFAYYGQMAGLDWKSQGVRFLSPLSALNVAPESWRRFLDLFSQTPDEFAVLAASMTGDWQMRSVQEKPLLRFGDDVVVLDERFLMERITTGLYWLVHDHEKTAHSETARHRWTQAYGEMHELLVEDYLAKFAPVVLGGGRSLFTEEDLAAAFGVDVKRADVGIDFGSKVLIADAQAGQLSTKTREDGDAEAFKRDLDRIVIRKAAQLNKTAECMMGDPQPTGSPLTRPAIAVLPIVVPGGTFPTSPITRRYIADQLTQQNVLTTPGVEPLIVLDLRDLEHAEGVRERDGASLIALVDRWQSSDYRETSLSDWLIREDGGSDSVDRPGILRAALERSFEAILSRVTPDPLDEPNADLGDSASN